MQQLEKLENLFEFVSQCDSVKEEFKDEDIDKSESMGEDEWMEDTETMLDDRRNIPYIKELYEAASACNETIQHRLTNLGTNQKWPALNTGSRSKRGKSKRNKKGKNNGENRNNPQLNRR